MSETKPLLSEVLVEIIGSSFESSAFHDLLRHRICQRLLPRICPRLSYFSPKIVLKEGVCPCLTYMSSRWNLSSQSQSEFLAILKFFSGLTMFYYGHIWTIVAWRFSDLFDLNDRSWCPSWFRPGHVILKSLVPMFRNILEPNPLASCIFPGEC